MNPGSTWRTGAALFGKAPWNEEYLRAPARHAELRSLDEWIFRNASAMPALSQTVGREVPIPTYGFLVSVDASAPLQAVAGVLSPSQDKAGRAYPLVVAAAANLEPRVVAHPEVAPILLESYWEIAVEALTGLSSETPAVGDRSLERATETPLESALAALELYTRWTRETSVADLCALLGRSTEWLDSAGRQVLESASPSLLAIRVPLGGAAGSALCFWLDVLRRAGRWEGGRAPSFFWSHDGVGGDALLCPGAPGESVLAALWTNAPAGEIVCDLARIGPAPPVFSSSGSGQGSVATFLEELESARSAGSQVHGLRGPR